MTRILTVLLAVLPLLAAAEPASRTPVLALEEQRYCGAPERDASGRIKRSHAVLAAFVKIHPCPANLSTNVDDPCPGWALDHVIPRGCGGCDAVSNLQWLPNSLKSAAVTGKDRFERLIYCEPMRVVK